MMKIPANCRDFFTSRMLSTSFFRLVLSINYPSSAPVGILAGLPDFFSGYRHTGHARAGFRGPPR